MEQKLGFYQDICLFNKRTSLSSLIYEEGKHREVVLMVPYK